jgi:hypothetical protein
MAFYNGQNSTDHQSYRYGALRAKNLAEEIVVGWTDQTSLQGIDAEITRDALDSYAESLREGAAAEDCDEVMREVAALHCAELAYGGGEGRETLLMSWGETMIAARALEHFSGRLLDELNALPPEQAEAA